MRRGIVSAEFRKRRIRIREAARSPDGRSRNGPKEGFDMLFTVGSKLVMFDKVRQFSRAHPSTDPGYAVVLNRFEGLLNSAEVLAAKNQEARTLVASAQSRRKEVRRVVHFQLLRYLVKVGEVAAKTRAELVERFSLPRLKSTHREFVTAVRSMLNLAQAQKEALVSEGMSPVLLDDLARMLDELEERAGAATAAGLARVGSRSDLLDATAELMEMVGLLDGINRWRFGKDPDQLREWKAATHLQTAHRPSREAAPPSGSGTIPPSPGRETPAA